MNSGAAPPGAAPLIAKVTRENECLARPRTLNPFGSCLILAIRRGIWIELCPAGLLVFGATTDWIDWLIAVEGLCNSI